jgi:hypothetical protein
MPKLKWLILFASAAPLLALAQARFARPHRVAPIPSPSVIVLDPELPLPAQDDPAPARMQPTAPGAEEPDDPPLTLGGMVVDLSGAPVAGARISVRNPEGQVVGAARSDQSGRFASELGDDPTVIVTATAGELRGLAGPVEAALGEPVRIVVARPGHVRGTIVDGRGMPVEDAPVEAVVTRLVSAGLLQASELAHARTRSDAAGQFSLELPLCDAWTISATSAGETVSRRALQVLGAERSLLLVAGSSHGASEAWSSPAADPDLYVPGITLAGTPDGWTILSAPSGSPILPGDVLRGVDQQAMGAGDPWERLAGNAGTEVELTILRPATGETLHVALPRNQPTDPESEGC